MTRSHFKVDWDGMSFTFQELSGLGEGKLGKVTMKRGVFEGDNDKFQECVKQIKMNAIKRKLMTIGLIDENGASAMVWTLQNAWLTKVTEMDLKPEGDEVAIETMEVACEGVAVEGQGPLPQGK